MSYLTHPRRRHHPCRRTHRMGDSIALTWVRLLIAIRHMVCEL
jgi:hypothetical protein